MRRPRIAQLLKLAGTLLCALILIAMFLNRYDWFDFDNRQLALRLSGGDFAVTWSDTTPPPPKPIFFGLLLSRPDPVTRQLWCLNLPLWPLLIALALPTLLLWRIDRRPGRSAAASPKPVRRRGRLHRRRARRRVLKRVAMVASLAAALALLGSLRSAGVAVDPTGRCGVGITRGTLLVFVSFMPMQAFRPKPDLLEVSSISWRGQFTGNPLTPVLPEYRTFGAATLRVLIIPLSSLLIALGLTLATLWLLDFRRVPPEACPECNYDLTGNTSGVCPECGRKCEPARMPEERPNGKCAAAAVRTAGPAAAASREAATE